MAEIRSNIAGITGNAFTVGGLPTVAVTTTVTAVTGVTTDNAIGSLPSFNWQTAGTQRVRIDNSGNVGVGTLTPNLLGVGTALSVLNTALAAFELIRSTASTSASLGELNVYNGTTLVTAMTGSAGGETDSGAWHVWTRPTTGALTRRISCTSLGLVGIGTASPVGQLSVIHTTLPQLVLGQDNTIYKSTTVAATTGVTTENIVGGSGASYAWALAGTAVMKLAGAGTGFELVTAGANTSHRVKSYHDSTTGATWGLWHARGTEAAPTALLAGDVVGQITFVGYTNAFQNAGNITCEAETGWGATGADTPTRYVFRLPQDGTSTNSEMMRLTSNGRMAVGLNGTVGAPVGAVHATSSVAPQFAGGTSSSLYWSQTTATATCRTTQDLTGGDTTAAYLWSIAAVAKAELNTSALSLTDVSLNETTLTIAAATTVNIALAKANTINVTSAAVNITTLGTVQAGTRRTMVFSGVDILVHNATSLILPTSANITTAANDTATMVSLGSGNWMCTNYQRASGAALVSSGSGSPAGANTQIQFNNSSAFGADADFTYTTGTDTLGVKNVTLAGAVNEFQGTTIASAATTDIGAATGNYVDVSGTTTITALGTVQAGTERTVRFTGILTLTYNATSLITHNGRSVTTAANDVAVFRSLGSGNWLCTNYRRANGSIDSANYVQIYSDNVATSLVVSRANASTAGAGIFVQKARGSQTALTSVVAGDTVGNFLFQGYNSFTGGYETCANISAIIGTGAVGSAVDMPGKLAFWTTPDGAAVQVKSFEIDELQRIVMLDAVNEFQGAAIASAATTDIGAATGNLIDVSGTTTITGLGTVQAGTERVVRFTGALTLTHNATSLILPGSANITTAANDVATFRSLGSGNWLCTGYQPAVATPATSSLGTMAYQNATAVAITGGTAAGLTTLGARSSGAAFDLQLGSSEVLTANRLLSFNVSDAARTLTLSGNPSLSGITTTGAGTIATGGFTLTVPATGTAALLATANIFTIQQKISMTSPYLLMRPSAWTSDGFMQFGVTASFAAAGDYAGIHVPAGKGFSFSQASVPLMTLWADGTSTIGTGTNTTTSKLEVRSAAGVQLALSYDAADFCLFTVGSTGTTTLAATGTNAGITLTPSGTGNVTLSAIPRFNGTNSTGAGSAALGANSPATTLTAPYTWVRIVTSDGSAAFIPAWK